MECPRCKTPLERKVVSGKQTEIDRCGRCRGVWFDHGEIGVLTGKVGTPPVAVPAGARVRHGELCPRCAQPLHEFAYRGTVTLVNGCRSCAGLWVHGAEVDELYKARRENSVRPSASPAPKMHSEIAGVKGTLIRFIDRSLTAIVDVLRKG